MERGGRIELPPNCKDSDMLVSVKDTGIGIPADKLPTIFEMFSQVENCAVPLAGRAWHRLVCGEAAGRDARRENRGPQRRPGQGQRVRGSAAHRRGAEAHSRDQRRHTAALISNLRILVVDDNGDAAASSAMLLKMMGNDVRTAYDGEEAVASGGRVPSSCGAARHRPAEDERL